MAREIAGRKQTDGLRVLEDAETSAVRIREAGGRFTAASVTLFFGVVLFRFLTLPVFHPYNDGYVEAPGRQSPLAGFPLERGVS
jgi:hypothetical protein